MTQPNPTRAPREWYRIDARAAADEDEPETTAADVYIYEQIGESFWGGGISAKKFADQIAALDVDQINLYINSPGGAAWEGITIMNALRRHRARVEVTVDGIAASAASVIAMAGDRIIMNRGAEMMIHDAWGFAMGNAADMVETADILSKLSDSIADTYAARAGKDRAHWRDLMQAETWYTAEEAVEAGLADERADGGASASATRGEPTARFDLSMFAYAGRAHAPAPRLETPELPSSTEPGDSNRKENVVAYDDLKAGLVQRLGVTDAAASDETLLAALDEALEETADTTTPTIPPANTVLMDAGALEELRADAAAGRQALEAQSATRREGIVASAVREGRIAPASRDTWLAQLEDNEEGTTKLLNSLAPNTIPVSELGHQEASEMTETDRLYAKAWGSDTKEA